MFLVFMAASFVAPEPMFEDSWISPVIDIPRTGLQPDVMTSMAVELTVNTRGDATACTARVVTGNPKMGPYTCGLLKDRARFRPARDSAGKKIYGLYRTSVGWWIGPGQPPEQETPEHFRFVESYPIGSESAAFVRIAFAVDAEGNVSGCSPKSPNDNPVFAALACDHMKRLTSMQPARSRTGKPVPSVQTAAVRLVRPGR